MIETYINVTLTCDNCGKQEEYEDCDTLSLEGAETVAVKKLGWEEVEDTHLCPDCQRKAT